MHTHTHKNPRPGKSGKTLCYTVKNPQWSDQTPALWARKLWPAKLPSSDSSSNCAISPSPPISPSPSLSLPPPLSVICISVVYVYVSPVRNCGCLHAIARELRSGKTFGCEFLPSPCLRQSVSVALYGLCRLVGLWASPGSPVAASHLAVGVMALQMCAVCLILSRFWRFPWSLHFYGKFSAHWTI